MDAERLQRLLEELEEERYEACLRTIRKLQRESKEDREAILAAVALFMATRTKADVLARYAPRKRRTHLDRLGTYILEHFLAMEGRFASDMRGFLVATPQEVNEKASKILGVDIGSVKDKAAKEVLDTPWQSDERLWPDRMRAMATSYAHSTQQTVLRDIMTGRDKTLTMRDVTAMQDNFAKRAAVILRTEEGRMRSWVMEKLFKEAGVEEFKFVATLDERTSKICRSMNGLVFDMSAWEIGVTVPPLHPACRSLVTIVS